jgi:hypothetical protein
VKAAEAAERLSGLDVAAILAPSVQGAAERSPGPQRY